MTRFLLLPVVLFPCLWAQDPGDEPTQQVFVRRTRVRSILEQHPGAVELAERRGEKMVEFRLSGNTYLASFGGGMTYRDPDTGAWRLSEPILWETQRGWALLGGRVRIVIRKKVIGTNYDVVQTFKDPDTLLDPALTITYPQLTYQGEETFSFAKDGLQWTLKLHGDGSEFTAAVPQSMGSRTFRFPYQQRLLNLRTGPGGSLVGDMDFALTRAVAVGADRVVRPCGDWQMSGTELSFTCDDTDFPAEAFPYTIDPTTQFTRPGYTDETQINDAAHSHTVLRGNDNYMGIGAGVFSIGNAWGRYNREMFFRWDTSGLPDNATVTAASTTLWSGGNTAYVTYPYTLYWYAASRWPIAFDAGAANWGNDADSVLARYYERVCSAGGCPGGYFTLALDSNLGQISKTGYTSLRWKNLGGGFGAFFDFFVSGYSMDFAVKLDVTYTVPQPPTLVSASAISADTHVGQWITATGRVADPEGYSTLDYWHLLIKNGVDGTYACYFLLVNRGNYFHLMNDASSDWGPAYTMGTANFPSNSQCEVDVANSSFTYPNGSTDVQANIRLRLKGNMLNYNPIRTYLWARDLSGQQVGWAGHYSEGYVRPKSKLIINSQN